MYYHPLGTEESFGGYGDIEVIDSHQHFWQFDPVRDSWINDDMRVIQKDFLPENLYPLLQQNGVSGTVIVQSDQSEEENAFQLANAASADFVKGVVGWVDLQAEHVEERLQYYSGFAKMKGFRHVLQGETNPALMLKPAFKRGISLLEQYGFTYDILIYPQHLRYAIELVKQFPEQPFVIDHLAKPLIKQGELQEWKKNIETIAQYPNVYCKLSGLVTEADWQQWNYAQLYPYLDAVVQAFGTRRVLYGSDWPVCLVAASYTQQLAVYQTYFEQFSNAEKEAVFGVNATRFYQL